MRNSFKLTIIAFVLLVIFGAIGFEEINKDGVHANITFDEQGRVTHADGEHNKMYILYDKNGNEKGAIWAADACAKYGTTDVAAATSRWAKELGCVAVKVGEDPTPYLSQPQPATTETPAATQEETKAEAKPEAKAEEKPKYEHGIYDGITEDALNAFDYFTADGVADSCYIQIKENAEQRTMPGSHISKTAANSEYGEVQFVNENEEVVYKFVFPQVKAGDDFSMELTPVFEDTDEGTKVDFKDEKLYNTDIGFEVDFFFQTNKPSTKLYVYTSEADGLHEYNTITTDADGFARLPYTMVQDYTFSETDLVAAAEEAKAKEQAEAEAKRLEEEAKKAAEEQVDEPIVEDEPIEPIVIEEKSNAPFALIGIGAVVLIGIGIFAVRKFTK